MRKRFLFSSELDTFLRVMFRRSIVGKFFQRSSIRIAAIFILASDLSASDPVSKLVIDPSSTRMSLARCELTVGTLECKADALCGTYAIKVSPFAFKNDHGRLSLGVDLQKMAQGQPVEFSGVATSARDAKTKPIKGRTKPEAGDHGLVSFTVTTEDGDLLFNSTYRVLAK